MRRNFIEFVNNKGVRVLIDIADIKFIQEGEDTSKGYCKIYFYSSATIYEWVKEDYDSVIKKLNYATPKNSLPR